ncbi:RlmE family RNA methyltransferase [Elioraea tepida]|jgi:23S rRNA (uridine2552-2'-O)-methyltransferase|uniref:Ribosomal RNA large subunit methyltransferase E n=1 Tax=Elioraea tepida TaxID=2843330 RepID=A0A975U4Z5_9PROT|nr:RlmE family RNA methyltransferase [Elioraea tepida]QXM26142.1 RlmE family RNA methyltransferase [Elioraea tepida]
MARRGRGAAGGAGRKLTVTVRSARRRDPASTRWLQRHLNDPYVQAAKARGYRSRAAFKLIELDDRFRLIRKGARVLDLGAAPGGWTQVAVERAGAGGTVVGVDILPAAPVPGATLLQGDLTDAEVAQRAIAALGGRADLVLSDMAPNTVGHAATDHLRIVALAEAAMELALAVLAPGGAFVCKVFQGGSERGMLATLKRHFASVRHAKPPASRKESAETYVVATGFRPGGA